MGRVIEIKEGELGALSVKFKCEGKEITKGIEINNGTRLLVLEVSEEVFKILNGNNWREETYKLLGKNDKNT